MTKKLLSIAVAVIMVLALVPMSVFARAIETEDTTPVPVTYTGDKLEVENPAVGNTFNWILSMSENASLLGAMLLVDFNETYLTCTLANTTWSGGITALINAAWTAGDETSSKVLVTATKEYTGGTGDNPYGESGNIYSLISIASLDTDNDGDGEYDHGGVQMGGPIVRLTYKWKAIPADNTKLPMDTVVINSYCHANPTVSHTVTLDQGYVWVNPGQEPEPTDEPIVPAIEEGYYVVVAPNGENYVGMIAECTSARMGATDVTVRDGVVVNPPEEAIWYIEDMGDGTWGIYSESYDGGNGGYCYAYRNNTSGFAMGDEPTSYWTIDVDETGNFTVATTFTGNKCISYYPANNDFRTYAANATQRTEIYLMPYIEEEIPQSHDVTYTGEIVTEEEPAVNDTFYWGISVSELSSLYAGHWYVDYDENYLQYVSFEKTWGGSLFDAINETWDEGDPYSDTLEVVADDYTGTGNVAGTTAGNKYTQIGMFLMSFDFNGVQMGGMLGRIQYKWIAIPAEADMEVDDNGTYLPMHIVCSESLYFVTSTTGNPHDNIEIVDGKIYVTVPEITERNVTYTGEIVNEDDPAVGGTFYWGLSVSEYSGLYAGHWYVDYDENFLQYVAFEKTWGGSLFDAINETWDEGDPYSDTLEVVADDYTATGNVEGTTAGNKYTQIGMFLMSFDFEGVQMGGMLGRIQYKWIALPTAEDLETDDNGTYLPMHIVCSESLYYVTSTTGNPHDNIEIIDGKIYLTLASEATLTITYIYEDGTEAAPTYTETMAIGTEYSVTSPEIEGYTPDIAVVSGTLEGETTVIVTYTINTYTITWVIDGVEETEEYAYGATPTHAEPTKPDDEQFTYTFAGWDPEIVPVTGDATYTATWSTEPILYTITWVIDGEEEIESYAYGETPTHADPTKPADAQYTYTFAGWDPEIVPVTGEATYTATWTQTPVNYTITIYYLRYSDALEDWVALQSAKTITVAYGTDYDVNDQIPEEIDGYVLDHTEGTLAGTMPAENVEINAYYVVPEPDTYTLTINYRYGDGTQALESYVAEVASGAEFSVESPAIEGYTPDIQVVSGVMGDADLTINVVYYANIYTLTIHYVDENGNELYPDYVGSVTYGSEYSVTSPTSIANYYPNIEVVEGVAGNENIEITVVYTYDAPYEPVPPTVAGVRAELRERATQDAKRDIRFVLEVNFNDSYITYNGTNYGPTQEYFQITKFWATLQQGEGTIKTLNCNSIWKMADYSFQYTVVIKGIPETYEKTFTVTPYILYSGVETSGEPIVTTLSDLINAD